MNGWQICNDRAHITFFPLLVPLAKKKLVHGEVLDGVWHAKPCMDVVWLSATLYPCAPPNFFFLLLYFFEKKITLYDNRIARLSVLS